MGRVPKIKTSSTPAKDLTNQHAQEIFQTELRRQIEQAIDKHMRQTEPDFQIYADNARLSSNALQQTLEDAVENTLPKAIEDAMKLLIERVFKFINDDCIENTVKRYPSSNFPHEFKRTVEDTLNDILNQSLSDLLQGYLTELSDSTAPRDHITTIFESTIRRSINELCDSTRSRTQAAAKLDSDLRLIGDRIQDLASQSSQFSIEAFRQVERERDIAIPDARRYEKLLEWRIKLFDSLKILVKQSEDEIKRLKEENERLRETQEN